MKCINNKLPQDIAQLQIEAFGDLHIGSKKCDINLIQERIKRVQENANVYCIILGDLINNSTKTSVGDVYSDPLTPMQQIQLAVNLFMPIKDKILGVCSGNHEARTYKQDGIDLLYFFCTELGIADKYDYASCLLFIRFGDLGSHGGHKRIVYTLHMAHGTGQGGRTVGGKANGLQRRGQIVNSDIVVTGHTHTPMTFRDSMFEINYGNNSVALKEQVFINISAALNYEEYADIAGFKPSSKKSPTIVLDGRKRRVDVIC